MGYWQTTMETNESDPARYPKEIHDITWWNTSEEILKEGYKIWANTYDKVRINSMSVIVYSACRPCTYARIESEALGTRTDR